MHQKIFVTGGTGFVGSYLLRYLVQQGYKNIRALKRSSSKMDLVAPIQDRIEWIEGDILDLPFLEEVMIGIDQVYHCAAMISFNPQDAAKMLQINEMGTENIVNTALLLKVKKMVHISSIAAVGKEKYGELITEKTAFLQDNSTSNYAYSKYMAEMQVWRGIAEGLDAVILNPSVILGSGFWDQGSSKIFQLYGEGFPFYTAGSNGFVDVRDVARMAILAMESDITEQRFIVNSANLPFQKVFNLISEKAGVTSPNRKMGAFLGGIAWRFVWLFSQITGKAPTITKESVQSSLGKHQYSNEKSVAAFDFRYTPIERTIEETVGQFLTARTHDKKAMFLPL
ncbi:MAG: NAD-dependent epimerase/dehydratase family protein [Bacteroidota bacterium]